MKVFLSWSGATGRGWLKHSWRRALGFHLRACAVIFSSSGRLLSPLNYDIKHQREVAMPGTLIQQVVLAAWAVGTVYLVNRGGRNNGIFRRVVSSGFRLILIGCIAAALIGGNGDKSQSVFTMGAVNFVLVLSAAVGANYISHANMSLRDFPNKTEGPEQLPDFLLKESKNKVSPSDKDNI